MLLYYRWNQDRLLEMYMDSSDDALRAIGEPANVSPKSPGCPPAKRARISSPEVDLTCGICYDTSSPEDVSALRCTHAFCNECWEAHITQKVKGEGNTIIPCMADGCKTKVDEAFIKRISSACHDR